MPCPKYGWDTPELMARQPIGVPSITGYNEDHTRFLRAYPGPQRVNRLVAESLRKRTIPEGEAALLSDQTKLSLVLAKLGNSLTPDQNHDFITCLNLVWRQNPRDTLWIPNDMAQMRNQVLEGKHSICQKLTQD